MMTERQDGEERSPETALRGAGLRVTAPRVATLAVIGQSHHPDADTIATAVRERLGAVSKQAVYDVLHALADVGLVRRISVGPGAARFEIHRHDNHHHLVCTRCGRIEDVPCELGEAPCIVPPDDLGFEVEVAEVLFRGTCAACREELSSVP
jgi:Fe2+ or Zn2+ uptake regulation protein